MREKGRERERGAAPRAFLRWSSRSPPSPESKAHTGGVSVDSGEWTEVRNRRRKALREAEEVTNRLWQRSDHQSRSISISRLHARVDHHGFLNNSVRDHHLHGLYQSRYSRDQFQGIGVLTCARVQGLGNQN
jgi:hypothetical protein